MHITALASFIDTFQRAHAISGLGEGTGRTVAHLEADASMKNDFAQVSVGSDWVSAGVTSIKRLLGTLTETSRFSK